TTIPAVEYSSTCFLPSAKKSGHSHISPESTGLTLSRPVHLPCTSGCKYSHFRKSRDRNKSTFPPTFRKPDATPRYHVSPSRHRNGSRNPVIGKSCGGSMTGLFHLVQLRNCESLDVARHCTSRKLAWPSRSVARSGTTV